MQTSAAQRTSIHFDHLDGWRGAAILLLLIGHFLSLWPVNWGRLGVEFFFVLSGYLMSDILFVKNSPLPRFYARRVVRIYPALLVYLAFAFVVATVAGGGFVDPWLWLSAATLTFNYGLFVLPPTDGQISHIWSLCVEEHTYLLLGLIALLVRRFHLNPTVICAAVAGVAILNGLVSTVLGGDYYDVYWRSDVRCASILIGAIAYLALRNVRAPVWLPVLLLALGFVLNHPRVPDPMKYSLGTAALAASLVLLSATPSLLRKAFSVPLLRQAGVLSFSVYLWQQLFLPAVPTLGVWAVVPALLCGAISFYVVERPVRLAINERYFPTRIKPQE